MRVQLKFFVRWICIENGLEGVVEFFNYLATVNTALGSAVSFYIAIGLNASMILLEGIEIRLTRRHGGKQTPWDRFFFGQVRQRYRWKILKRLIFTSNVLRNCAVTVPNNKRFYQRLKMPHLKIKMRLKKINQNSRKNKWIAF